MWVIRGRIWVASSWLEAATNLLAKRSISAPVVSITTPPASVTIRAGAA